jgi:glutathione synthase/RimK-type ligase-like ATP-grasp enzyme
MKVDLARVLEEQGWSRAVIKPAVSGNAYRTHVVTRDSAAQHAEVVAALASGVGLLVQPYLPEIEREGELSLVYFDGAFSHAVVKTPASNDFRVQFEFGGQFRRVEPTPSMLRSAQRVLSALPEAPVYARVDGVVLDGELHLMEVELIEPYLYLREAPEQAAAFVSAVAQRAQLR